MKSSTQLLILGLAVCVTGVFASAVRAAETVPDRPAGPPHGSRLGPPAEVMKVYDVDQNGVLDVDERAVLHEDIASGTGEAPRGGRRPGGFGGPGGPGGPGRDRLSPDLRAAYDVNQDGRLGESERAALHADIAAGKVTLPARGPNDRRMGPPPELVAQYDANKDGELDEAERAALRADIESGKIERPAPPRRQRQPEAVAQ